MSLTIEERINEILDAPITPVERNKWGASADIERTRQAIRMVAQFLDEHQKERGSIKYLHGEPV